MTEWLQLLANGIVLGSILALCAIGLTLVYGILDLANFAHGDLLTFGAYGALFFGVASWWGSPHLVEVSIILGVVLVVAAQADRAWPRKLDATERWVVTGFGIALALGGALLAIAGRGGAGTTTRVLIVASLLAIFFTVLLSVVLELILWRPLRKRRSTILSLVIASLGLSLVIRAGLQVYFGGDFRSLTRPIDIAGTYGGVSLSNAHIVTIGTAVAVIVLVHLLLTRTRVGKAMRALSDNRDLARVCGIDVDRVIVYVWILASALVAIGGVMLTLVQNNSLNVNMGFSILIPIFASVVLGGVGSAYGAMAGGLIVGIAMRIVPAEYDLAAAFGVLILVLLVRPQGIFGGKIR